MFVEHHLNNNLKQTSTFASIYQILKMYQIYLYKCNGLKLIKHLKFGKL